MSAQQAKACDAADNDDGRESPPRKKETSFIFIDSSNSGVNGKPDKVVRSFVMKSARNKKPWSTRPTSPRTDIPVIAKARRNSPRPKITIDSYMETAARLVWNATQLQCCGRSELLHHRVAAGAIASYPAATGYRARVLSPRILSVQARSMATHTMPSTSQEQDDQHCHVALTWILASRDHSTA
jgi:hypothetical protein